MVAIPSTLSLVASILHRLCWISCLHVYLKCFQILHICDLLPHCLRPLLNVLCILPHLPQMYCPVVAVVLSTTPTLVSAMVLGAILLQIHAPSLFLCRILSMSCVAHQLRGHILMPMSFLFWWLAWCMPSFPPKQRMQVSFKYKKQTYSLSIQATPAQRRKWDEVMHYLNHLPEFVNEVFDDQQMKNTALLHPCVFIYKKGIKDKSCT